MHLQCHIYWSMHVVGAVCLGSIMPVCPKISTMVFNARLRTICAFPVEFFSDFVLLSNFDCFVLYTFYQCGACSAVSSAPRVFQKMYKKYRCACLVSAVVMN